MNIKEIEITPRFQKEITVGLIQLHSPFFSEIDMLWNEKGSVLGLNEKTKVGYKKRVVGLMSIFNFINSHAPEIDIIVIPEYSFVLSDKGIFEDDKNTLDLCKRFAASSKVMLIGNYYDDTKRTSESFCLIPEEYLSDKSNTLNGVGFFTASKYSRTSYDSEFLISIEDVPENETHILRMWWNTNNGKRAYIQIFTCKDYLYFTSIDPLRRWPNIIDMDHPGMIFSLLCSSDVRTFENHAMVLLRDANYQTGVKSIVSCFCNAVQVGKSNPAKRTSACGRSQIISPIDIPIQNKPCLCSEAEGLIISRINPFKAISKPTMTGEREANSVILSSNKFELITDDQNELVTLEGKDSPPKKHIGYVINPYVLYSMGFKRLYGFLRSQNYQKFKNDAKQRFSRLPNLSIAMHGVYGIHDVLSLSWEEFHDHESAREILKLRFWPMARKEEELDEESLGCCFVERFIKFHGIEMLKENLDGVRRIKSDDENFRREIRDIMINDPPEEKKLQELIEQKILLKTVFDTSDMSESERLSGKMEFLVLIRLIGNMKELFSKNIKKTFESTLLPILINDDKIRTIEEISAERTSYIDADYILHFVGNIKDLNKLVLDTIHDVKAFLPEEQSFLCKTMVVLPAEPLAEAAHPSLIEQQKIMASESSKRHIINVWKNISDNEHELINNIIPSSLHNVHERFYRHCGQAFYMADLYSRNHLHNDNHWMGDFYSLLYAVTASIGGQSIGYEIPYTDFERLIRNFVMSLAKQIESTLSSGFNYACLFGEINPAMFESALSRFLFMLTSKNKAFSIDKVEIGSAALAFEKMNLFSRKDDLQNKFKNFLKKNICNLEKEEDEFNALYSIIPLLRSFGMDLTELSKAVKKFSAIRNAVTHHNTEEQLDPGAVIEGVFFGLRFLDDMSSIISENKSYSHK